METENVKSRKSILTAKLYMGVDVKSRKSILTEKLYTGMNFGVNSTTQREVVSSLLLMSDFETAPFDIHRFPFILRTISPSTPVARSMCRRSI